MAYHGIRRAIAPLIREVATTGRVLVLTTHSVLAEQWRERLVDRAEAFSVTLLETSEAALALLNEAEEQSRNQVLLSTTSKAVTGLSRRALAELDYDLVVLDEVRPLVMDRLRRLIDRAGRVVALTAFTGDSLPEWPLLADYSLSDVEAAMGRPLYSVTRYASTDAESVLQREADQLRSDYPELASPRDERADIDNLAALYSTLLGLAANVERPPETTAVKLRSGRADLLARIWNLVDRVEIASAGDSRLRTLERVVVAESTAGFRCVVVALRVSDISYVSSSLADLGYQPVALVSSATEPSQRKAVISSLEPGQILVCGSSVTAELADVPTPCTVVLWSPRALTEVLDRIGGLDGVRIRVLMEEGSAPPV